jgi:hypothetical protein
VKTAKDEESTLKDKEKEQLVETTKLTLSKEMYVYEHLLIQLFSLITK